MAMESTTPEQLLGEQAASHWVVVTSRDAERASQEARRRFQELLLRPPLAQREQGASYGRAYQVDP
jgi:hypothetical protein